MAKGSSKKATKDGSSKKARARRPETESEKSAREAAADADKVNTVRMIAAAALKRSISEVNTIMEGNAERAGEIGSIVRTAQEKGMDAVAFRMLLRLFRKGQRDPVKLRSIMDCFDYGRDVLKLDEMKAANIFLDEGLGKKRSRKEVAEIDPNQTDIERDTELVTSAESAEGEGAEGEGAEVHSLDDHRQAVA